MSAPYPGKLEREKCASVVGADVAALVAKPRPLSFEDDLTVSWLAVRCGICRACPVTLAALKLMRPPAERPSAEVVPFRRSA